MVEKSVHMNHMQNESNDFHIDHQKSLERQQKNLRLYLDCNIERINHLLNTENLVDSSSYFRKLIQKLQHDYLDLRKIYQILFELNRHIDDTRDKINQSEKYRWKISDILDDIEQFIVKNNLHGWFFQNNIEMMGFHKRFAGPADGQNHDKPNLNKPCEDENFNDIESDDLKSYALISEKIKSIGLKLKSPYPMESDSPIENQGTQIKNATLPKTSENLPRLNHLDWTTKKPSDCDPVLEDKFKAFHNISNVFQQNDRLISKNNDSTMYDASKVLDNDRCVSEKNYGTNFDKHSVLSFKTSCPINQPGHRRQTDNDKQKTTKILSNLYKPAEITRKQNNCVFCAKHEDSSRCHNFSTKKDRIDRALDLNLCVRCFRSDHNSSNCGQYIKCTNVNCNIKSVHHTFLCPLLFTNKKMAPPPTNYRL